jgi:hypothetical protein
MGLESLSSMNLEKLKNSAVNQIAKEIPRENLDTSEEIIAEQPTKPTKKVKAKKKPNTLATNQSELAKELEALRVENERLKSLKAGRVRFKDFKATTFRVKPEQYELLKELETEFPDKSAQLELISSNSITRGLLDHLMERKDELDFSDCTCDLDIYNELKKIFK